MTTAVHPALLFVSIGVAALAAGAMAVNRWRATAEINRLARGEPSAGALLAMLKRVRRLDMAENYLFLPLISFSLLAAVAVASVSG